MAEKIEILEIDKENNQKNNGNLLTIKGGVKDYCSQFVDLYSESTLILSTTKAYNIKRHHSDTDAFMNLHRINDIRYINKFFKAVNKKLPVGGIFIGKVETFSQRHLRKKICKKPVLREIYFLFEFIFMRVFPKVWGLKKIYFFITKGKNRLLSKAETLGRLVFCGFDIIECKVIDNHTYFVVKKVGEPYYGMDPGFGLLFNMQRIGQNRKTIKVFKIRTMYPYAEYLQKFMYERFGYSNGDKANNDFRITSWGKVLRKFWIDELPMIYNLIKGDIKIVGVRPLSMQKFMMYPKIAQEKRILSKPGLFPPFYYDYPTSFEELVASELKYLEAYSKNPVKTDFKYFFVILKNIIFKGRRSS